MTNAKMKKKNHPQKNITKHKKYTLNPKKNTRRAAAYVYILFIIAHNKREDLID